MCVKDKCCKCKGHLKTTLQYEIISETDLAGMEAKVKLDNCRKRGRKDVSMPVHAIYEEELSDIYALLGN
jgi:hypothetical protein